MSFYTYLNRDSKFKIILCISFTDFSDLNAYKIEFGALFKFYETAYIIRKILRIKF